jgi:hypothetical protein
MPLLRAARPPAMQVLLRCEDSSPIFFRPIHNGFQGSTRITEALNPRSSAPSAMKFLRLFRSHCGYAALDLLRHRFVPSAAHGVGSFSVIDPG